MKKSQEKDAASIVRGVLDDAMSDQQKRMKQLDAKQQELTPAPDAKLPISQSKVTSIEEARQNARKERDAAPAYIPPAEKSDIITELEKYEYLFGLLYREGMTLREADSEWMEYYESTEEYQETAAPLFERRKQLYVRVNG